jgi:hypothetical protein
MENPLPLTVAALTVTAAVPVEERVSDCVLGEFKLTSPKAMVVALTPSVAVAAPSCNEKVSATLPAVADRFTVRELLTVVTVAVKPALVAPEATVTDEGTVTALLLLARLTVNPPLAAAAFRVTVQLSVPALVIELFAQARPVKTGRPEPLILMTVEVPVDELLLRVNVPDTAPAAVGSNCTVSAAD